MPQLATKLATTRSKIIDVSFSLCFPLCFRSQHNCPDGTDPQSCDALIPLITGSGCYATCAAKFTEAHLDKTLNEDKFECTAAQKEDVKKTMPEQCDGLTCQEGEFCWADQCQKEANPCTTEGERYCGVLEKKDKASFEQDFKGSCHTCEAEPTTCTEFVTFVAPNGCYHSCALGLTETALVEWGTTKFDGVQCDDTELAEVQAELAAADQGSLSGAGMPHVHAVDVAVVVVVGVLASMMF